MKTEEVTIVDLEAKKKMVLDFYKTSFVQRDPEKAVRLYIGDYYTQHNPRVPDGIENFITYVKKRVADNPDRKIYFHRVFAEGDFVVMHTQHVFAPTDAVFPASPYGVAAVDIFRLENGKIVEHWDVHENVPERAVHDNTMF
jgi:predicted SnoaL-like aldol condensation-catalyzing enzyme